IPLIMANPSNINFGNKFVNTISTSAEAIGSYLPFLNALNALVKEINQIYENAECNKEICLIMTDRVAVAEAAIRTMLERNHSEDFYQKYLLSLKRFENNLINIKEFTNKVSKLEGYRKYLNATEIKKTYEKLIKDYDTSMNDLQFTIAVVRENANQNVDTSLRNVDE
ncbi:10112_t:CDS:1, partial [Scutellospora calospora]